MRQDQWSNTVTIDGRPLGVWDTLSGGDVESEETKYKPGGMGPEITLGGSVTVNNVTLGRLLRGLDDWEFMHGLMANRVGKARVTISRQPLDVDANPFGRPMVYRGVLQAINPGDTDSNSSDAHAWEITVSTEGSIA